MNRVKICYISNNLFLTGLFPSMA